MILLDPHADTFPEGLSGTPFEEVFRALRIVAADAWSVDPTAYRAGMAWGWYALHVPESLVFFRDVVVAALISAMAPLVKDSQTDSELVEYLRQWREYTPTFPKLQHLYKLFGADVDIEPISDPESQAVLPVEDTRLAFYVRIEYIDFSRPLSLSEAREIAVRATPLGSRPYPYYALETRIPCTVSPAPVGVYIRLENWNPAVEPAPSLPTVSTTGDFGQDNWLFADTSGHNVEVLPGATCLIGVGGGATPTAVSYDAGKSYAVIFWSTYQSPSGSGRVEFAIVDVGGLVYAQNNTASSLYLYAMRVAVCSSSQATVVTVYDSSNVAYNAFKYTLSGTPYWYVIDGEHDTWTDDLSAWGYSEVQPVVELPVVTLANAYVYSESDPSTMTVSAGSNFTAKDASGNSITYNYSILYNAYASYYDISSSIWFNDGWTPIESSGLLAMMNNANFGTRTVHHVCYATCSDSTATVVTVYNSSNVAYNAFKYNTNGTDYYYVLDGTQTDWTDDLSSIGYKTVFPLDLIVGMNIDNSTGDLIAVTFDYPLEENYWNTRVKSAGDKELLRNLGLWVDYADYLYGSVLNTSLYRYEIIEIYTGVGEGIAPFDLSNFYIPNYQKLSLGCTGSYSTPVKSWKLRITPSMES